MGAGKSAVARILGERMGTLVADLDAMIEAEEGTSVAELFERAGEPYFRRRESELLERALAAGARDRARCPRRPPEPGRRQPARAREARSRAGEKIGRAHV